MNGNLTRAVTTVLAVVVASIFLHGCGEDPVKPTDPPRITQFTASPPDIMPGDSSLITYTVTGADSTKLFPSGTKLSPAASGSNWVKPPIPTAYGLVAYNKGGKDSASLTITMSGAVPIIESFVANEDTILIGDSTVLSWQTLRADSIVINNGLGRMSNAASGQITAHPTATTSYRAIAYNQIGTDTATASARVEIPYAVNAVYGTHFKGAMGAGIVEPEFRFRVLDQAGVALRKPWLYFSVVEGDGTLLADSLLPDANGAIINDYTFDGQLGYGVVRAIVPGVDTLDVKVRASVIRFGADGQGQYVRLWDTYADVLALNGTPVSVDHPVDTVPYYYVNYEQALGVVPVVYDLNEDGVVQNSDPVIEVIVNTVFSDTSEAGIRIGSSIHEVRAAYGTPDVFYYEDNPPPPAWGLRYNSLGVLFWASPTPPDSSIFEIHLWDPTPPVPLDAAGETHPPGYSGRQVGIRFSLRK
jgi:hypothetical protein